MQTDWDYTKLATSYLKRPSYAPSAIEAMIRIIQRKRQMIACDIGAGVAHLTLDLAPHFTAIHAIEPNKAMRKLGKKRTKHLSHIEWFEGTGEETKQPEKMFDICTFGSSFNVCNKQKALEEVKKILRPRGWFACMWNHRDLDDPIQQNIEAIISQHLKEFSYGTRREDQTEGLNRTALFKNLIRLEGDIVHRQSITDIITAWRSHASLNRQSGTKFNSIIDDIEQFLRQNCDTVVKVPYTTRIWLGQLKN